MHFILLKYRVSEVLKYKHLQLSLPYDKTPLSKGALRNG